MTLNRSSHFLKRHKIKGHSCSRISLINFFQCQLWPAKTSTLLRLSNKYHNKVTSRVTTWPCVVHFDQWSYRVLKCCVRKTNFIVGLVSTWLSFVMIYVHNFYREMLKIKACFFYWQQRQTGIKCSEPTAEKEVFFPILGESHPRRAGDSFHSIIVGSNQMDSIISFFFYEFWYITRVSYSYILVIFWTGLYSCRYQCLYKTVYNILRPKCSVADNHCGSFVVKMYTRSNPVYLTVQTLRPNFDSWMSIDFEYKLVGKSDVFGEEYCDLIKHSSWTKICFWQIQCGYWFPSLLVFWSWAIWEPR